MPKDQYAIALTATLSDLTLNQPYTLILKTSHNSAGFNYHCQNAPANAFTPTAAAPTGSLSFTLLTCAAPGGTITAELRKGGAGGDILDTATAAVTVTAAIGSLSPTPSALTVGYDQTFTVNTNIPNDPGLWISVNHRGNTGAATPTTWGCRYDRAGLKAVNGNAITLRGCYAGTATIKVYRGAPGLLLATYTVTINPSDTTLSPTPSAITVGYDQTFTVNTNLPNVPGFGSVSIIAGIPAQ